MYRSLPQKLFALKREEMRTICRDAWEKGLFSGVNGNASLRFPHPFAHFLLFTATHSPKRALQNEDFCLINTLSGKELTGQSLSSESPLHETIYAFTDCQAILHTHPPKLLALDVLGRLATLTELPLFEVVQLQKNFAEVDAVAPGTAELALQAQKVLCTMKEENEKTAVCGLLWLKHHGLVAWGSSLQEAMNLSEEAEHLAEIALLTRM